MDRKVTADKIKIMIALKKDDKTIREIAEIVGVSETTIYNHTKGIKSKKERESEAKRDQIRSMLLAGNSIEFVARNMWISEDYVRKIRDTTKYEELERKQELYKTGKTKRYEEVEKISRGYREQKEAQLKYEKEQLEYEKERLVERFPYAFK